MQRQRVDVLVLPGGGTLADACGPLHDEELRAVDVPFDRRTWLLEREATDRSTAAAFFPVGADFCRIAAPRFRACEQHDRVAVVRYAPQPLLNVLALLDVPIRPFGDGCVIELLRCTAGRDRRAAFPIRHGRVDPTGPTGRAIAVAEQAIVSGDTTAYEPGSGADRGTATTDAVATQVRTRRARFGPASMTGPATVAVSLQLRSPSVRVPAQLVRVQGEWRLAWSTQCAIAVPAGIPCVPAVPQLFPGSVWR